MSDTHFVLLPESPWAGPTAFLQGGPDLDLHRGVPVAPPSERLRYELRVDKHAPHPREFPPLDLHDPGNGQLLISEKLQQVFKDSGVSNLQLFSAEVRYALTGEILHYQVANILGMVKALDTAEAECQLDDDGFLEGFTTLRLATDNIAGFDLFRMYESFHTIIVSSRVKQALEAHSISGIRLLKDTEWQPGML